MTGEERIVAALAEARTRDVAPPRLHAQIRTMHGQRAKRPAWRGTGMYAGAFATAVAAIVAVVILASPGGTPGAPTLAQAVALSARAPAASGPRPDSEDPAQRLNVGVGRIYFPNWSRSPGWRAVGKRVDTINGRRAVTVYYVRGSREVAYTIVGAPILRWPAVAPHRVNRVALRTLALDGRLVTTWRRGDHTCVLSSTGVTRTVLERLASW
jgi:hypothetical protein